MRNYGVLLSHIHRNKRKIWPCRSSRFSIINRRFSCIPRTSRLMLTYRKRKLVFDSLHTKTSRSIMILITSHGRTFERKRLSRQHNTGKVMSFLFSIRFRVKLACKPYTFNIKSANGLYKQIALPPCSETSMWVKYSANRSHTEGLESFYVAFQMVACDQALLLTWVSLAIRFLNSLFRSPLHKLRVILKPCAKPQFKCMSCSARCLTGSHTGHMLELCSFSDVLVS